MKVYEVEFMTYTISESHVAGKKGECLTIGKDRPILITEDMIEFVKNYGNGIKSLKYVGNMIKLRN